MKAYGYIFLDPEKQYLVPVVKQQQLIEEYGMALGVIVSEYVVEQGVPAHHLFQERKEAPGLLQVLREGDLIIASHTDMVFCKPRHGMELIRLLRRKKVSLHLADLGGDVVFPSERRLAVTTGISDLVTKLLVRLAERERPVSGSAIAEAKRRGKRQGRYPGGPVAFGWEINREGFLVENPVQQKIIREIVKMRENRVSYREIAKRLAEQHDLKLSHEGIRKVLLGNDRKREELKGNMREGL